MLLCNCIRKFKILLLAIYYSVLELKSDQFQIKKLILQRILS